MQHLHANSSLPRSGSELLQALLGQHPDVYASATSPVLEYWYGAMGNFTLAEVQSQQPDAMRTAFAKFCARGAEGYYSALTDKPTVVDKSRGWLEHAEALWRAFPDAKIVCMTRDPEQIVASLERIYQENLMHPEVRHLPPTAGARRAHWLHPESKPLGLALRRIEARQQRGADSRIAYVSYDALVDAPVATMAQIFAYLGLEPFNIDPNNVQKSAAEDDSWYGIFGDHKLHPRVHRRN